MTRLPHVTYNLLDLSIMGRALRLEEPMTEAPRVTIGTVISAWEPDYADNRENRSKPSVTLQMDRQTPLPRMGERVAFAGSVDAIHRWMQESSTLREDVLAAAIAWAEMVNRFRGVSGYNQLGEKARALYDAVQRAKKGDTIRKERDKRDIWDEVQSIADAQAPSEDPREALGRRVAEAIGGDGREITVIILGELD